MIAKNYKKGYDCIMKRCMSVLLVIVVVVMSVSIFTVDTFAYSFSNPKLSISTEYIESSGTDEIRINIQPNSSGYATYRLFMKDDNGRWIVLKDFDYKGSGTMRYVYRPSNYNNNSKTYYFTARSMSYFSSFRQYTSDFTTYSYRYYPTPRVFRDGWTDEGIPLYISGCSGISKYRVFYKQVEYNTGYNSGWKALGDYYLRNGSKNFSFVGYIPDYQIRTLSCADDYYNGYEGLRTPTWRRGYNMRYEFTVRGMSGNSYVTDFVESGSYSYSASSFETHSGFFAPLVNRPSSSTNGNMTFSVQMPSNLYQQSSISYIRLYARKNGTWVRVADLKPGASVNVSGSTTRSWDVCYGQLAYIRMTAKGFDKNGNPVTPYIGDGFYFQRH